MRSHAVILFALAIIPLSYGQNTPWPTSGNVGIGTTAPDEKLVITGDGAALKINAASNSTAYYTKIVTNWDYSRPTQIFSNGTEILRTIYASPMSLSLMPTGGNVGIGTVNPQTPLHVIGPITAGYDASTWGEDYLYGAYGSGKLFVLGSQYSSGGSFLGYAVKAKHLAVGYVSSTDITIPRSAIEASGEGVTILTGPSQTSSDGGTVNISERMRIDAVGNVGIGTTNPSVRLEVADGGGVYQIGTNSAYWSGFKTTAPSGFWGFQQNERAFFGVGGNVYSRGFSANAMGIFNGSTTAEDIFLFNRNNPGGGFLVLKANDNVGIGTTTPTEKLSVNGKIRAKEVIVDTNWSDYVFAKDYKLAPLSEVEQHIEQQGHLPGVPSAQEVAEKGVSVGDMQAILLAKIEELTLHQIAQEKRVSAQDAKLEVQAAEIAALKAENARLK